LGRLGTLEEEEEEEEEEGRLSSVVATSGDADEPDSGGGSGKGGRGRGARASDCRVGSGATMAADKLPEEADDDDDDARAVLAFFRLVVVLGAASALAGGGVGTRGCCVVAAADGGPALALALAPLFLFARRVFFFDGAGAVADAVGGCASSSCSDWEEGAVLSERAPMSSVIPSGVSADADGGGGDTGAGAGGSAPWLVAVAVVAAIAGAFGAPVSMRGTSTKSAVSDRGELSGDEEERAAEEDKDQTISSSSSEVESLAHLVLDVCESERMSSDEDREVVMVY